MSYPQDAQSPRATLRRRRRACIAFTIQMAATVEIGIPTKKPRQTIAELSPRNTSIITVVPSMPAAAISNLVSRFIPCDLQAEPTR